MELDNEAEIIEVANRDWPREACGLVYDRHAYTLSNVANPGTKFFIMDLDAQAELYEKYDRPPDAVWHSHPNDDPNPSPSDLKYHPQGMRMLIVADGKVHDHGYPTGP